MTIIFCLNFAFQFNSPSLRASLINSNIARVLSTQESPAAALVDLQAIKLFVAAQEENLVKAIAASAKEEENNVGGDVFDGKEERSIHKRHF